ncbi:radical SAM-associated putative lipoprotein [Dysgonomonas sp. Marseille-P4677]|uniref:radical SAM-associated putative lipoprotein n=1 Tax=Dysgonomonas sp. Marseille-P4677 TaxID=2364790 RepID=UPI001913D8C0|nr:radical SAM-associated putative lipoprotein [Dysgonomonas sp. Marseille-P4677]MBK5722542.1 radical SAM-associated putative lipoprotein [Dysgonomonas sp. Marseille-P4677]
MKTKAHNLYSKLISICLLILGFSACGSLSDDDIEPIVCEYGVPSAKYKVSGKVVTAEDDKQEVKNIRVVMIENVDESKVTYLTGDTVFTDTNGEYKIERIGHPGQEFIIKFQDIDGEANGQFEEQTEIIDFKDAQYVGGEGWFKGEATKDMGTIELGSMQKWWNECDTE